MGSHGFLEFLTKLYFDGLGYLKRDLLFDSSKQFDEFLVDKSLEFKYLVSFANGFKRIYLMKRAIVFLLFILSLTSCFSGKVEITKSHSVISESDRESNHNGNQATFSSIALNDEDSEVRKLAVKMLTLQSTLSSVALNDIDPEVRLLAVSKLDLQSTLSSVALKDKDREVRKLALKRLNEY